MLDVLKWRMDQFRAAILDTRDKVVEFWRPVRFVLGIGVIALGMALGSDIAGAGLGLMLLGTLLLIAALHSKEQPADAPSEYCTQEFYKPPFVRGRD